MLVFFAIDDYSSNSWFGKKNPCQTLCPAALTFTPDVGDFLLDNVRCLALIYSPVPISLPLERQVGSNQQHWPILDKEPIYTTTLSFHHSVLDREGHFVFIVSYMHYDRLASAGLKECGKYWKYSSWIWESTWSVILHGYFLLPLVWFCLFTFVCFILVVEKWVIEL